MEEDQSNSNKTSVIPSSQVEVMLSNSGKQASPSSNGFVTLSSTSSGLAPSKLDTTAATGGSISGNHCNGNLVKDTAPSKINRIMPTIVNFARLIDKFVNCILSSPSFFLQLVYVLRKCL